MPNRFSYIPHGHNRDGIGDRFCDFTYSPFEDWIVDWSISYTQAYDRSLEEIPHYGEPANDHFQDGSLEVPAAYRWFCNCDEKYM